MHKKKKMSRTGFVENFQSIEEDIYDDSTNIFLHGNHGNYLDWIKTVIKYLCTMVIEKEEFVLIFILFYFCLRFLFTFYIYSKHR